MSLSNDTFPEGIGNQVTLPLTGGFQSFEFTYDNNSNYYGLQWIKIDGNLLVDSSVAPADQTSITALAIDVPNNSMTVSGGSWDASNSSQVWSNNVSSSNGYNAPTNEPPYGFDGSLTSGISTRPDGAASCTFTGLPNATIRIFTYISEDIYIQINSNNEVTSANIRGSAQIGTYDWVTLPGSYQMSFLSVRGARGLGGGWNAVEVGGQVLVDAINTSQN